MRFVSSPGRRYLPPVKSNTVGKSEQKVVFTHEDFDDLDPTSKLEAFVEVSATAQTNVVAGKN